MESRPPWWRAPPGPIPAPRLLGLFLLPWTLQLAGTGGQSVTHTGLPIVVSLANKAVSFGCRITYPYTPTFKHFTVSYFYVDLLGRTSSEEKTSCKPGPGRENQTHTEECQITPKLPDAAATGTYYCSVRWPGSRVTGNGTFILVRDTGYREPPQGPQDLLLLCFIGLLAVLGILATALLLWKKRQTQAPRKHTAQKGPSAASSREQPPPESVYTDLQRRETEVYDCIQSEASSPPSNQDLLSQEKQHGSEGDGEFNLVYENL
ncbi:hypothetical protein DBR06_SOUSAS6610186 [Sousa chinensis]|uniref:NFAT activation molecule 1 n=1 Tax=Tursiops truncatus TaxID=9739 RepID=A0A6J3S4H2_TURTR|nr:NFAT activation molecule 1 [Tursiops truncatus]XP_059879968.1 NFAT activation molecule 1 [Delphinus delphis]TEA32237.1 hypothetical protein DBR06_SOUSAS6610186 [Sousa chinensis]